MTEPGPTTAGREANGRFGPGNRYGKGGARRRVHDLRRAVEEAVSTDHLAALVRKATRMGLEGNLAAMRLVFERTCGRPVEVPIEAEPVAVRMPRLHTAADCAKALELLVDEICSGDGDRETTRLLMDAIQLRLKAIETTELEARLAQLEEDAKHTLERRR